MNGDLFTKELIRIASETDKSSKFSRVAAKETGVVSVDEKDEMFQFLYNGPNGLKRIAMVMKEPLKERIDYFGIGRKLLQVDDLPVGEHPIYDKDIPEFASVKIGALGSPTQVEFKIKRIMIPTFGLGRSYKFGYEEQQVRLFPIFDRAKERVAISMAIAEDKIIFGLLDKASQYGPNPYISPASGSLDRASLVAGWKSISRNQLIPATVVMHPDRYGEILTWGSDELDQVTLNLTTETGSIGKLFGMTLLVTTKVSQNTVYVTTTPSKLGRIPLRKDMEIKIFDYVPKASFVTLAWEQIGMGIHNTYGVSRIEFNPTVTKPSVTVEPTPHDIF